MRLFNEWINLYRLIGKLFVRFENVGGSSTTVEDSEIQEDNKTTIGKKTKSAYQPMFGWNKRSHGRRPGGLFIHFLI